VQPGFLDSTSSPISRRCGGRLRRLAAAAGLFIPWLWADVRAAAGFTCPLSLGLFDACGLRRACLHAHHPPKKKKKKKNHLDVQDGWTDRPPSPHSTHTLHWFTHHALHTHGTFPSHLRNNDARHCARTRTRTRWRRCLSSFSSPRTIRAHFFGLAFWARTVRRGMAYRGRLVACDVVAGWDGRCSGDNANALGCCPRDLIATLRSCPSHSYASPRYCERSSPATLPFTRHAACYTRI